MKIDTHAHVFSRDCALAPDRRYDPDGEASVEQYMGLLDSHGIDYGVLVQPSFLGTDNGYLVSALARAAGRLRGIAVVDGRIGDGDLDALAEAGVVGIRLNLIPPHRPIDLAEAPWRHLLRRIAKRGWIVEIQADCRDLGAVLEEVGNAGARAIVDHFGRVAHTDSPVAEALRGVLAMAGEGLLWVKLSAPYRFPANARAIAEVLVAEAGPERLLWGSDWPWTQNADGMTYAKTLNWLEEWVPDGPARRLILGDTPARLFGFPGHGH